METAIYVVEDEPEVARLLELHLTYAGYRVRLFGDGVVLLNAALQPPALFILDVALPGMSGFDLCQAIRQDPRYRDARVLFLTARDSEDDRICAFECGADDFVAKPFGVLELMSRVRTLLRQHAGDAQYPIRVGEVIIDPVSMTVTKASRLVSTTTTEFRLLTWLASHPRRVFTREQLLNAVWGDKEDINERCIDVYIRKLREKIEADPARPAMIKTLRGTGYRFDVPEDLI